jgi:transposase
MSSALTIVVKESFSELKKLVKKTSPFLQPRLQFLITLKKYDGKSVSKRALMEATGLCSYSVHKWRTLYKASGIDGLLSHGKKGFKPKKITALQHEKLKEKLADPQNGIRGYKELQEWMIKEFKTTYSYITVYKYCTREFGTKIKMARKYHAKKDEKAVDTFKKTLVVSASQPASKKKKSLKV